MASVPSPPRLYRTGLCRQFCNNEDVQESNVVTMTATPALALFSQKETRKASSVPATSGEVAPNKGRK